MDRIYVDTVRLLLETAPLAGCSMTYAEIIAATLDHSTHTVYEKFSNRYCGTSKR